MKSFVVLMVLLCGGMAGSLALFGQDAKQGEVTPDAPADSKPRSPGLLGDVEDVVAEQIAVLREESMEDSITMSTSLDFYLWPGRYFGINNARVVGDGISLSPELDTRTLVRILSNRRVIKLVQESQQSREEACRLLRVVLQTDTKRYLERYDKLFTILQQRAKKKPLLSSFGLPAGDGKNDPVKTPTINGLRYKILMSLVLLGHLEDQRAQADILEIVAIAMKQKDAILSTEGLLPSAKESFTATCSLYNKRILATALLQTAEDSTISDQYEWQKFRMVDFDVPATPFDLHATRGMVRVQYPEQDRVVSIASPMTDEQFAKLLEKF